MFETSPHHRILRIPSNVTVALMISLLVLLDGSWLNPIVALAGRPIAPDFNISSLDGTYYSNFKLEGERALLMFWAPWCGFCRKDLPKLAKFYQRDIPDDLQMLTIGTLSSLDEVEQYVTNHPGSFPFPAAYDEGRVLAGDFGIRSLPTYVLLDGNGTILLVHRGSGILKNKKFQQLFP